MKTSFLFRASRRAACAAAVAAGLLFAGTASSQVIPRYAASVVGSYIPREIAMLPRYCIFTQVFRENVPGGNDKTEVDQWYAAMGEPFHHMHHYCYGLMNATRASLALDAQTRNFYLQNALKEFDYVLERTPQDFVLMPEVLTKKGDSLVRLGRGPVGLEQYELATQIKPDYWPAYGQMSDYFKDIGDRKKAREVLAKGLSFAPESKGLLRRMEELDAPAANSDDASKRKPKPASPAADKNAKGSSR